MLMIKKIAIIMIKVIAVVVMQVGCCDNKNGSGGGR
jgi:hypothetical protein